MPERLIQTRRSARTILARTLSQCGQRSTLRRLKITGHGRLLAERQSTPSADSWVIRLAEKPAADAIWLTVVA
jgi:hypothetical protein